MNKEIRSVRLRGGTTVLIVLRNTTHKSMEILYAYVNCISGNDFSAEILNKGKYKRVRFIFDEPTIAKSMFLFISNQILESIA